MLRCFVFTLLLGGTAMAVPLPHDVYVWQRAWTEPLRESLHQHATSFNALAVLAAEVTWKNKQPQITRVALNYTTLRDAKRPIGFALRIGPSAGSFRSND